MENLITASILLRAQEALKNDVYDAMEKIFCRIENHRDTMANDIMNEIDEMFLTETDRKSKQAEAYLKKEWVVGDHWSFAQQYINLAIIDACHYEWSVVALPPNKKVLAFLLPKLKEAFGIVIAELNKNEVAKVIANVEEAENLPRYSKKNWVFFKITLKEE